MLRRPKYKFNKELKKQFFERQSMKEIAKKLSMSNVYLSYLINGRFYFDEYTAKSLMEAVGFSKTIIKEDFNKYFKKI